MNLEGKFLFFAHNNCGVNDSKVEVQWKNHSAWFKIVPLNEYAARGGGHPKMYTPARTAPQNPYHNYNLTGTNPQKMVPFVAQLFLKRG